MEADAGDAMSLGETLAEASALYAPARRAVNLAAAEARGTTASVARDQAAEADRGRQIDLLEQVVASLQRMEANQGLILKALAALRPGHGGQESREPSDLYGSEVTSTTQSEQQARVLRWVGGVEDNQPSKKRKGEALSKGGKGEKKRGKRMDERVATHVVKKGGRNVVVSDDSDSDYVE